MAEAAREAILARLKDGLRSSPPFSSPRSLPASYLPVTSPQGDREAWLHRFGAVMERLGGEWAYADSIAGARLQLLARFQEAQVRRVVAWDPESWPLPGLYEGLTALGVEVIVPDLRHGDRAEMLRQIEGVDWGITGAMAALARTGTLVLTSGRGLSRVASLMPPWHLALVPMSRLYPNLEAWLADVRRYGETEALFSRASQIMLISGPSRTADIEMSLTLGVHGPRYLFVMFFEER